MPSTLHRLTALWLLGLSQLVVRISAHITLAIPLGFFPDPSNSRTPLSPEGADYPCKTGMGGIASVNSVATTSYTAGEQISITLAGEATHGGGSCQFSLSYDGGNTWGVIYSIVGQCLASTKVYAFTLPPELPGTDSALLAWTWYAFQGGLPELYMNCAPVKIVSSSSGPMTVPALFKANMGNKCSSIGNCDVKFPKPGQFVLQGQTKCNAGADSPGYTGTCGADPDVTFQGSGSSGGGGGGGGAPAPSASDSVSPTANADPGHVPLHVAAPSVAQAQSGKTSQASIPPDNADVPAPLIFKGDPQKGLEEVNFVAKNKAEAEAEYALGLQMQGGGGRGGEAESGNIVSAATGAAGLAQSDVPSAGGTPQSAATASQSQAESPAGSSASGSTSGQEQGSCSGTLKCSDDGKAFFLCSPSGWISMGSVAAGTICKNGAIGHANV